MASQRYGYNGNAGSEARWRSGAERRATTSARNANGQSPTSCAQIGEWITQPSGGRQQARARTRAERASEGRPAGPKSKESEATSARNAVLEEPVVDADKQCAQSEEKRLEGLLAHLTDFPPDDGVEELRTVYRDRLGRLRKDNSERHRDPTLHLLRAQRLTRKRERQREAAAIKLGTLESQMEQMRTQVEEARAAMDKATDVVAEARLEEESLRVNLATTRATPRTAPDLSGTVQGLMVQFDALPAAFQSGNMEAAYAALRTQLERIAAEIQNGTASHEGNAGESPVTGESTQEDPYGNCYCAEAPAAEERNGSQGRRGTSPECETRSRSRSNGSASSSDQEGKLHRAANQPGQRRIRGWFTATASAGRPTG